MPLTTEELYRNTLGRTPSQEEVNSWGFGSEVDAGELDRFLGAARNEAVETKPTAGAVGKIAQQILSQNTMSQWKGEGFGSADKNAYDMAVMLAGQGITDINEFGVRNNENGDQEYYNKTTGQPINAYYDKAKGNTWGGTFAGEGSTAYKVNFQDGVPVFYTQFGGSSNDLMNIVGDNKLLMIAANVGAAYLGGPAAVAALQAAMGKDIGDIAKAAALTYVGGEIASGVSGTQAVIDTLGQAGANIAGKVVGAAATGRDPLAALATGGLGQMVGEGIGFEGTTASTIGSSLVSGVVAELRDQDVTDAMLAGAVTGYLSGEKNIRDVKKASDEDIAGGMVPEYGTNEAYDTFMRGAMTPDAMTSIESMINETELQKAADADIAGGMVPAYGTNEVYDGFMKEAMTPEAMSSMESLINNRADTADSFDATEREGSLVKDGSTDSSTGLGDLFKPMSGTDAFKTGVKTALAGGAVAAGASVVRGLGDRSTTTTTANDLDIYKDAPLKGFHMRQDPTSGRYIPYVNDVALLAKGGFVSKRK